MPAGLFALISVMLLAVISVRAQAPSIPGVEASPINTACPITDEPIGSAQAVIGGHTVGFATEEAREEFLTTSAEDQEEFVLSLLEPANIHCPIDGTPATECKTTTLREGFAVACCDSDCVAKFNAWPPGRVGVFIRETVEPINTTTCPQTGDDLVPDDPYYVAHLGRLLELCCDYCLMEWQYQPKTRDASLMRALGIEAPDKPESGRIALP